MGCVGPVADPVIEAHRGAAGYWPQNSRAAVEGTIAADFDGLEVDLVLTRDGHAVLAHDPFLDPKYCTDSKGDPLPERVRIDELRLRKLQTGYLCGGLPDDDFPNAEVIAQPVMAYEDMIDLLKDASAGMRIHLDLKVEPGWTPPADDWIEPVLETWWANDMPQSIVVTANTAEAILAFEEHARANGRDLQTQVIFPRAPVDSSATAVGLANERDMLLGKVDYIDVIEEAQADGIAVNFELAEKHQLMAVQDAGYEVALWTLNSGKLLEIYSRWPVDVLITDYPRAEP